ncbi:uncharacterized protein ACRADG_002616 [Cochliomyia hominivorax]
MQKITLFVCLVLLAAVQIRADCNDDFDKLCSQRTQGTIPFDCDKSCTKFIICYIINDQHKGILKNCPKGQYFDKSHKVCSIKKPANCN